MITLSEAQIEIMGKPNFACSPISNFLISYGVYAPKPDKHKAEYEQAVFIHWANVLYELHGDSWRKEASIILDLLRESKADGVH